MNRRFVVLLIGFTLMVLSSVNADITFTNSTAVSSKREMFVPLATQWVRGHYYVFVVPYSRLQAASRCNIETNELPLSPRGALLVAEKYVMTTNFEAHNVRPQQIRLEEQVGEWFYIVTLAVDFTQLEPGPVHIESIEIPVLLDGTVPKREERVLDPKTHVYIPVSELMNSTRQP